MRVLPSFTKACIGLAMYTNRPRCTGLLLNLFIEVLLTHVPIHLRILFQGDGVACLIDTCRVNDPDRAQDWRHPQVLSRMDQIV
jgi:hypothetical protein